MPRSFVQHCTPEVHRACSRRDPGPLYCEVLHCVVMHILSVHQLFSMDVVSTFQLYWKPLLSRFTYTLSCHVFVCTCNQERCCCIPWQHAVEASERIWFTYPRLQSSPGLSPTPRWLNWMDGCAYDRLHVEVLHFNYRWDIPLFLRNCHFLIWGLWKGY